MSRGAGLLETGEEVFNLTVVLFQQIERGRLAAAPLGPFWVRAGGCAPRGGPPAGLARVWGCHRGPSRVRRGLLPPGACLLCCGPSGGGGSLGGRPGTGRTALRGGCGARGHGAAVPRATRA